MFSHEKGTLAALRSRLAPVQQVGCYLGYIGRDANTLAAEKPMTVPDLRREASPSLSKLR
jgi:hypothetical protein